MPSTRCRISRMARRASPSSKIAAWAVGSKATGSITAASALSGEGKEIVRLNDTAHAHWACSIAARLAEVHTSNTALRGIARVGASITTHGRRGVLVFDRHIVQLHARAASGNEGDNGKGKGKTFDHPKFS